MTVNAKSRERSSDGRRTELIDAALRVLARDGVASATTRKIADEAGLPLGAVHYWFAGKDDLMEAVIIDVLDKLSDAMERAAEASNGATLLDSLRAAWRVVEDDDPGAQLALYELTSLSIRTPAMRDLARRQYALYRETAKRSTDAGSKRPGPIYPEDQRSSPSCARSSSTACQSRGWQIRTGGTPMTCSSSYRTCSPQPLPIRRAMLGRNGRQWSEPRRRIPA